MTYYCPAFPFTRYIYYLNDHPEHEDDNDGIYCQQEPVTTIIEIFNIKDHSPARHDYHKGHGYRGKYYGLALFIEIHGNDHKCESC